MFRQLDKVLSLELLLGCALGGGEHLAQLAAGNPQTYDRSGAGRSTTQAVLVSRNAQPGHLNLQTRKGMSRLADLTGSHRISADLSTSRLTASSLCVQKGERQREERSRYWGGAARTSSFYTPPGERHGAAR